MVQFIRQLLMPNPPSHGDPKTLEFEEIMAFFAKEPPPTSTFDCSIGKNFSEKEAFDTALDMLAGVDCVLHAVAIEQKPSVKDEPNDFAVEEDGDGDDDDDDDDDDDGDGDGDGDDDEEDGPAFEDDFDLEDDDGEGSFSEEDGTPKVKRPRRTKGTSLPAHSRRPADVCNLKIQIGVFFASIILCQ
jgi:hypothetical protein